MILAASLIFGTLFGWRYGRTRRAYTWFTIGWLVVLAVQTALLWSSSDSIRDRSTGEIEAAYPILCAAVFVFGLVVVTGVGALHQRRQSS
jgi:hypothetical protein